MSYDAHHELHELLGSRGGINPTVRRALFMLANRIDDLEPDSDATNHSCAEALQVAGGYVLCTKTQGHTGDHYVSLGPNSLTVSWPQGTSILGAPSP